MEPFSSESGSKHPGAAASDGVGSSDGNSGGGAGAGTPSGDLALREGAKVTRGSVEDDKKKLFPELFEKKDVGTKVPQAPRRSIRRRQQRRRARGAGDAS